MNILSYFIFFCLWNNFLWWYSGSSFHDNIWRKADLSVIINLWHPIVAGMVAVSNSQRIWARHFIWVPTGLPDHQWSIFYCQPGFRRLWNLHIVYIAQLRVAWAHSYWANVDRGLLSNELLEATPSAWSWRARGDEEELWRVGTGWKGHVDRDNVRHWLWVIKKHGSVHCVSLRRAVSGKRCLW